MSPEYKKLLSLYGSFVQDFLDNRNSLKCQCIRTPYLNSKESYVVNKPIEFNLRNQMFDL